MDRGRALLGIIVCMIFALSIAISTASGRTWIVDRAGGGDADHIGFGINESDLDNPPWERKLGIFANMSDGDTVVVRNGTYIMPDIVKDLTIIGESQTSTMITNDVSIESQTASLRNLGLRAVDIDVDSAEVGTIVISNCTFEDYDYDGIMVVNTNNTFIDNCTFLTDIHYGIRIMSYYEGRCFNTRISNCVFVNNSISIYLETEEEFRSTIIENCTVNGKDIEWLMDEKDSLYAGDPGQLFLLNCSNITISGLEMSYADSGIEVLYSESITIKDSSFAHMGAGIRLANSTNCLIENVIGHHLNSSGVTLSFSDDNIVRNCTFLSNRWGSFGSGFLMFDSEGNVIDNCTIRDVIGKYSESIALYRSPKNTIANCTISNSLGSASILLFDDSDENMIRDNIIYNSRVGISIHTDDNVVTGNLLHGIHSISIICRSDSEGNNVFDNAFYRYEQAELKPESKRWQPSYNSTGVDEGRDNIWFNEGVGNYWSSYTGEDVDDDGKGDVDRSIPGAGLSADRHPLIKPGPDYKPENDAISSILIDITGQKVTGEALVLTNHVLVLSGLPSGTVMKIQMDVEDPKGGIDTFDRTITVDQGSSEHILVGVLDLEHVGTYSITSALLLNEDPLIETNASMKIDRPVIDLIIYRGQIEDEAEPGDLVNGTIEFRNEGNVWMDVEITASGIYARFERNDITLQPMNGSVGLNYSITIPDDAKGSITVVFNFSSEKWNYSASRDVKIDILSAEEPDPVIEDDDDSVPGFELMAVMLAIMVLVFIERRKRGT